MPEQALRRPPIFAATHWLMMLPPACALGAAWGMPMCAPLVAPAWGVGFPRHRLPRRRLRKRATLWLGPDEHLLLDLALARRRHGRRFLLFAAASRACVRAATGDTRSSISATANSRSRSGARTLQTILRGGCPLDLDIRAVPGGACALCTVFAKADVTLWRTRDRMQNSSVEVWRSFAGLCRRAAAGDCPGVLSLAAPLALQALSS